MKSDPMYWLFGVALVIVLATELYAWNVRRKRAGRPMPTRAEIKRDVGYFLSDVWAVLDWPPHKSLPPAPSQIEHRRRYLIERQRRTLNREEHE